MGQPSAYVNAERYAEKYRRSIEEPEAFWREESARIDWIKPWTKLSSARSTRPISASNGSPTARSTSRPTASTGTSPNAATVAIIWEGDDPSQQRKLTYRELHERSLPLRQCVLKALAREAGDRVTIYMPMIPEAAVAMLACARIGAIHSVVFGGFSPEALAGRIQDCDSKVVITADGGMRGGKLVPLKANVDEALSTAPRSSTVLVVRHVGNAVAMQRAATTGGTT
jgi:acetyl-CoA synthetase